MRVKVRVRHLVAMAKVSVRGLGMVYVNERPLKDCHTSTCECVCAFHSR